MIPFRSETLANGLVVTFFDYSNRYFGDYHRVRVEIRIAVPRPDRDEPLVKVQLLERMGVPGAEVPAVRQQLCDNFWEHASVYLARTDYAARLLTVGDSPHRRRLSVVPFHAH